MKRTFLALMCMVAMMAASTSLKAQEVTIVLNPGWTWISSPSADTLDFTTALSLFTPATGDIIRSQWGSATYLGGQWRGTISQFYPGYGYKYNSTRTESVMLTFNLQPGPSGDDHEYVDLGLPSGLLWATCNVGANAPEEYGDYFAWAETQPKEIYDWSTYLYCMGSKTTLTKYCNFSECGYNGFTDNLTVLLPEDDAATVNWGAGWRTPSRQEWQELCNNTTCTWTTQNGINGMLFTATNGNSIFMPAAGMHSSNGLSSAGSYGYYWANSIYPGYPYGAWGRVISSSGVGDNGFHRNVGCSVRPVQSGQD